MHGPLNVKFRLLSELGTAGLVAYKPKFFCKKQEGNLGECGKSLVVLSCLLQRRPALLQASPWLRRDTWSYVTPPKPSSTEPSPHARHVISTNCIMRFVFHHIRTPTFWTQTSVCVTRGRVGTMLDSTIFQIAFWRKQAWYVGWYMSGKVGRDSSVGIATRYGLGGPAIESRCRRDFPRPSRPTLGPTQTPVLWLPGLSRG
jgi:hypothetical protein